MSAATVILLKMKKCIRMFKAAGATSAATAIDPASQGIEHSLVFDKLLRRGILVPVNNRFYYLDEQKEAQFNSRRRMALGIILLLVIVGIILGVVVI